MTDKQLQTSIFGVYIYIDVGLNVNQFKKLRINVEINKYKSVPEFKHVIDRTYINNTQYTVIL